MESDVKAPDPWKRNNKDEGGVHRPQPFFSFNNPQFRFSFWYILVGTIAFFLVNVLVSQAFGPQERLISFSEFKQRIGSGEIKQVQMDDSSYLGLTVTKAQETSGAPQERPRPKVRRGPPAG